MHQLLQIFLKTSTQSSTGSLVEKSGLPLLELEQQVVPDWKEGGGGEPGVTPVIGTSFVEAMRMILQGSCSTLDRSNIKGWVFANIPVESSRRAPVPHTCG